MTDTSTIMESRKESRPTTPVLNDINPKLAHQVAAIIAEAGSEASPTGLEEETPSAVALGYSIPMAGVRYYAYV